MTELSTILRLEGAAREEDGVWQVEVVLGNPSSARKAFILFKRLAGPTRMQLERTYRGHGRRGYRVRLPELGAGARPLIDAALQGFRTPVPVPQRRCCLRAVLRAAFLCRGSMAEPERQNHLEIGGDPEAVEYLTRCMRALGIPPLTVNRRGNLALYLKDGDRIVDLLREVGAHNALLRLENVRISKDVRNTINRLVNCETANVDKTVKAAMHQVAAIDRIRERIGLHRLPENLRELARQRLQHPYASLKELGELMTPPLPKSTVNYRVRRLMAIARELEDSP